MSNTIESEILTFVIGDVQEEQIAEVSKGSLKNFLIETRAAMDTFGVSALEDPIVLAAGREIVERQLFHYISQRTQVPIFEVEDICIMQRVVTAAFFEIFDKPCDYRPENYAERECLILYMKWLDQYVNTVMPANANLPNRLNQNRPLGKCALSDSVYWRLTPEDIDAHHAGKSIRVKDNCELNDFLTTYDNFEIEDYIADLDDHVLQVLGHNDSIVTHQRIVMGRIVDLPQQCSALLDEKTVLSGGAVLALECDDLPVMDYDIYTSHSRAIMIAKMHTLGYQLKLLAETPDMPDNSLTRLRREQKFKYAMLNDDQYSSCVARFTHDGEDMKDVDVIFTFIDPLEFIYREFDISMLKRVITHDGDVIALSDLAKSDAECGTFRLDFHERMTLNKKKRQTMLSRIDKYLDRGYHFSYNDDFEKICLSEKIATFMRYNSAAVDKINDKVPKVHELYDGTGETTVFEILEHLLQWLEDNKFPYCDNIKECHPIWNCIRARIANHPRNRKIIEKFGIPMSIFETAALILVGCFADEARDMHDVRTKCLSAIGKFPTPQVSADISRLVHITKFPMKRALHTIDSAEQHMIDVKSVFTVGSASHTEIADSYGDVHSFYGPYSINTLCADISITNPNYATTIILRNDIPRPVDISLLLENVMFNDAPDETLVPFETNGLLRYIKLIKRADDHDESDKLLKRKIISRYVFRDKATLELIREHNLRSMVGYINTTRQLDDIFTYWKTWTASNAKMPYEFNFGANWWMYEDRNSKDHEAIHQRSMLYNKIKTDLAEFFGKLDYNAIKRYGDSEVAYF